MKGKKFSWGTDSAGYRCPHTSIDFFSNSILLLLKKDSWINVTEVPCGCRTKRTSSSAQRVPSGTLSKVGFQSANGGVTDEIWLWWDINRDIVKQRWPLFRYLFFIQNFYLPLSIYARSKEIFYCNSLLLCRILTLTNKTLTTPCLINEWRLGRCNFLLVCRWGWLMPNSLPSCPLLLCGNVSTCTFPLLLKAGSDMKR